MPITKFRRPRRKKRCGTKKVCSPLFDLGTFDSFHRWLLICQHRTGPCGECHLTQLNNDGNGKTLKKHHNFIESSFALRPSWPEKTGSLDGPSWRTKSSLRLDDMSPSPKTVWKTMDLSKFASSKTLSRRIALAKISPVQICRSQFSVFYEISADLLFANGAYRWHLYGDLKQESQNRGTPTGLHRSIVQKTVARVR